MKLPYQNTIPVAGCGFMPIPRRRKWDRAKSALFTPAYCVCMFGTPGQRVWPAKYFDLAKSYGVEP